ncbi:huntingtin-like [Cydia pomonella]|uniref:huntingtin-like n=1 Tax=Cydia pomonella TaxID=82600 RepID=UPI002ADE9525|nr:huntingtin-like [Cydia pomonella]
MNVLERAEKALEYLKSVEGSAKTHELQAAAGTLGRCLGALGSRQNCARHYGNLLHSAIPTLLALASNDSAEIRLVGDEALNRAVVGGFAFHSHKTNIILQNQIDHTKNARWIRAALTRILLGESWLRPGVGKIRMQAQLLFPKLSQIVRTTSEIQLTLEALESNLDRILSALVVYTTDEEIAELCSALLTHAESAEAGIRRPAAACVALLCSHKESVLAEVCSAVFKKLWPTTNDNTVILAWFCVIKALFQTNEVSKFADNDVFTVQDYLQLYYLCIHYIERTTTEHNIQNAVLECLSTLLSQARGEYRKALLERHPRKVSLDHREEKRHRRNISNASISSRATMGPLSERDSDLLFNGALHLTTPSLSVEDLTIQTPDSPASEMDLEENTEHLSKELLSYHKNLTEKLQEIEESETRDEDHVDHGGFESGVKVNIGASADDDIPLKYLARLLASKFLLTANKGGVIPDRVIRVSVKSSALNCMSEILQLYPQAITIYLDKDADAKSQNISGSSEGTDYNQDHINDFILERNVCYQDSLTDSLTQDLLNRSMDSHTPSQQLSKKDSKSLEKSMDSVEQKSSSKDVQSNILDSKVFTKNELIASAMTDSTNPNMTNSNFTTNSNMSCSNDPTTGYPMSSSGDILSSSIDLDMKFDHFGESTTNLDNLDAFKKEEKKRALKRTDEVHSKDAPIMEISEDGNFEFQHMSDVFVLFEEHSDPQIRGLVRVCIGNYLSAALELSHGDYNRWRNVSALPKEVSDNISAEKLVKIILKGLTDEIHSAVNHTLSSLAKTAIALSDASSWPLLWDCINSLIFVESNKYWLCRVNLCKLYEKLPYQKLFLLYPGFHEKSKIIVDTLFRLLADEDQRVRQAAAQTITNIIPKIFISKRQTSTTMLAQLTKEQSQLFTFNRPGLSLDLVKDMYFYFDLPEELRSGDVLKGGSLRVVVGDVMWRLVACNCKFYSQGLLECLQAICKKWLPWKHKQAYSDQGILSYCLDNLDYCNGSVARRTLLLDICRLVYPVEIHNIMCKKTTTDIFERDSQTKDKWQHLDDERVSNLAEKFLQVTLKMLNVLVHLVEDINPNVHLNKSGIALPGSPVRKKSTEPQPRRGSVPDGADDRNMRKRLPTPATSMRPTFAGHFFTEPFYMKLYDNLRATYSNHKINLDPKSSMFYEFLTTVLNCLAIQLELSTEREFGSVTEELLYYLKVIMPLRSDTTVYCITQLLKCLFGTNMITEYNDFMSIEALPKTEDNVTFYDDVMLINSLCPIESESRRDSVCSNSSQKLTLDIKNPVMMEERKMLMAMENFSKDKMDRKWSTNKKELERYIRLFEPVVIQALKSYTMQNDIPLQCRVLSLLSQLLTLRVNYCMLDSEQIFIAFLIKQLEYVEQHEIPNCCDLVHSILMFLVQLSSSKHHTKQIIEIPKLIQLCDGLMASGNHLECIAGLEPVIVKIFSNMGGGSVLGRQQQQEAQATREVLFSMLQKTMDRQKVLELVSCVLCLSQDHPESYYLWSELACNTLLNLLASASMELDSRHAIASLERLLECVYKDVLLEQSRVEMLLKILFKAPEQTTAPRKLKIRYLAIIMVILRKILILIPESEILLSINYLKSSHISPQSIFFNVKPDVDPLNVQNVNENCANLSPDVILVRFLFKTLTFAIMEVDNGHDAIDLGDEDHQNGLLYAVCVNIIVQVKHMLHLTSGCLFPLTAKTAQSILHNEQSGLNTGLYSPDENIPLDLLNLICLRAAHRTPLLTIHWSHLLIRLNFLSHKYWQKLIGFARDLPLGGGDDRPSPANALQTACVLAYCEYFAENGLSEAVHLTWLLVNRVQILATQYAERVVQSLLLKVQENAGASSLLLQCVAARCQGCLKDEFALNIYKMLSLCHETQSGALVFLICRIIGKLEPAIAIRFANLAIERCRLLKDMSVEDINVHLTKEDVQVALELLQREKVHVRYSSLVMELNSLASSVFDLSPLDLSQDRAINPQYIVTTNVDDHWLANQVKARCCQTNCVLPKISKQKELASLLLNLSKDELSTVIACPEFDRKLLGTYFKQICDNYLKEFLDVASACERKELERDNIREQREIIKLHEEMISSMDSNKLNVVNSLQVFKKGDKESKSQFFIPVNEKEKFGNLELTDEDTELIPPQMSELYEVAITSFDKSLSEIIRQFPKQNRPLSQSENFNLTVEQTIDKYTRRCHQVFQDKLFYQEFITVQTILKGFLESLQRTLSLIDDTDCDLLEKCIESILPGSLAKNIAIFSVISLQYLTFLIKNKKLVESPVHTDVSFRANVTVTDDVVVDNVIVLTIDNVAEALGCKEIWSGLNFDSNVNRMQSAISCLYAIVKYLVKDTKPITLNKYIMTDEDPKPDIIIIGDKLVTLIEYWESNFCTDGASEVLGKCYRKPIEKLLVSLARLDIVSNMALIPPIAWSSVEVFSKKDQLQKIDLPLQAFQDMDVLEAFLFRVNLIGWSSKKQFEEIWVVLLGALQGNGGHWAVRGITQLLTGARCARHVPRDLGRTSRGIQRLRNILVGTSFFSQLDNINLERIPLLNDGAPSYHCAEYNADYLKLSADITDYAPYFVRKEVKRARKNRDVDVNSCLQLLMDVTSQMLDPKAPTGLATRLALLTSLIYCSDVYSDAAQWRCGAAQLIALSGAKGDITQYSAAGRALLAAMQRALCVERHDTQELQTVHQKLLKSLSSPYAPLRQAALQGCLLQLGGSRRVGAAPAPSPYQELVTQLALHVRTHLPHDTRLSLYEQSLYWAVLFTLIELGHPDLINIAVDFVLAKPRHYCIDLVVKGISNTIRQQVLPKELKNNVIEKLTENTKKYSEGHALVILMVHLFSADNKLLSPKLTSDVSNMDPDILMNSMERITLLYKLLRKSEMPETKQIITNALKYFLRETLPPAATLSRVVIEFLETCKESEREKMAVLSERERRIESAVLNAEVVFEVFETSVTQDQLPVLSGWIFEALCHLLHGKISPHLLPYTLLTLLVSASSTQHIRKIIPLCYYILSLGFHRCADVDFGYFTDFVECKEGMSFNDRRLLCVVAMYSGFSEGQLERLKELCSSNDCLSEVMMCLDA